MLQPHNHQCIGNGDDHSCIDANELSKYYSKTAFHLLGCYSHYRHNPSDIDTLCTIQLQIHRCKITYSYIPIIKYLATYVANAILCSYVCIRYTFTTIQWLVSYSNRLTVHVHSIIKTLAN